jgi:DnaJ-class molecular chaperone
VINRNNGITQPGQVVSVEGEGMPVRSDMDARGDLYVSVSVEFPRNPLSKDKIAAILAAFPNDETPQLIRANSQ